VVDIVQHV